MIRDDTELMNFPLFCPKCKKEVIINVTFGEIVAYFSKKYSDDETHVRQTVQSYLSC